jgi:hypothetical protein
MPSKEAIEKFLKDRGKWDDFANRPTPDANHTLYPDGKYAGPVPDYDKAEQLKAAASSIPLTEEAWKNANRLNNGHAGTSLINEKTWSADDLEEWRAGFTPRVDSLGLIVMYAVDSGQIHIYQHGGIAPLNIFRDANSAENWVRKELEAKAIREAEAERVASEPPVVSTQAVDFSPAQQPPTREEFNALQSQFGVIAAQFGVIAAQQATIIQMLKERG